MNVKRQIFVALAIALIVLASGAFGARKLAQGLLRDGHVTELVQGDVVSDANGLWYFKPAVDVNDMASVVKAGTKIQLLPSTRLEQLARDVARRDQNTYLLRGRVTAYKDKNYIFPVFFRAVIRMAVQSEPQPEEEPETPAEPNEPAAEPQEDQSDSGQDKPDVPADKTNNLLEIPQDVLDKINSTKVVRTRIPPKPAQTLPASRKDDNKPNASGQSQSTPGSGRTGDAVLTDRMAFLDKQKDGSLSFVLDAYGLAVGQTSLKLLPCQALELTELRTAVSPEPMRFKIAGIKTRYMGEDYLLLQRAVPTYSQGNFRAFTQ